MNRDTHINKLKQTKSWDVIIIGGGATGLGIALESATRGYRTLLLEAHDFAKGTSSRSTKLIHGGVRYLQKGDISLVMEALQERGRLLQNAPHLVHHQPFLVPNYRFWEGPFYGVGLKIYDMLAGKLGIEPSSHISKETILDVLPNIKKEGLRSGTIYYDGQFDDARLAITLSLSATQHGATLINYMPMTSFLKEKGKIIGVKTCDQLNQEEHTIHGKVIINATGIFIDKIREMDQKGQKKWLCPSQGIHLVLPKEFLPGDTALLIPHTKDGRVLFLVPWHNRILVGTTDTSINSVTIEPKPLKKEIQFVLEHASEYLAIKPEKKDILSVFAGIRPLIHSQHSKKTASISRTHALTLSDSGLLTIGGGKWTTYRKMGEDAIAYAIKHKLLPSTESTTKTLHLYGYDTERQKEEHRNVYGSCNTEIEEIFKEHPSFAKKLHPNLPYYIGELVFSIRNEMAMTVEDLLARRTRSLLLDAKAASASAETVAKLLQQEHNQTENWTRSQITTFQQLAQHYIA